MTRLLPLTATLLAVAALRAFADDTAPAKPTPNGVARSHNEAADPNLTQATDEAKPTSPNPNKAGASNNAQELSTDSPAPEPKPKPKPETPAERTARLTKLLRYEINGDTRRILDATFAFPKNLAQLEADFDKCLDEERYADGEQIAAKLVGRLKSDLKPQPSTEVQAAAKALGGGVASGPHLLLKAWEFEATLCHRAAEGEFGAGPNRRRSVAVARLNRVQEITTEAWTQAEHDASRGGPTTSPFAGSPGSGVSGAAAFGGPEGVVAGIPRDPNSAAYLLLSAVKTDERQPGGIDAEITQTVNTVLDRVTVNLPVPRQEYQIGWQLFGQAVDTLLYQRTALRDVPDDALLVRDLGALRQEQSFIVEPLPANEPIRRSRLGTETAVNLMRQKKDDAARQERLHSTLQQLFPSETIEVHVVNSTAILRATLRHPVHEQQIVSIARTLAPNVLNQMTVDNEDADRVATVAEKLEPIGDDPQGLREVLARLYPKEHIEAHVLPANSAVVLRGHLSRPEYAQQVFDIANTSYGPVLYQMTPDLPVKATSPQAAPTKSTTRGAAGMMPGMATGDEAAAPAIASTRPTDVPEAALDREARQLATKFRTAKLDEQPALRRQMEQLTERHFEQRQQRRQSEIEDLAHRVDVLRVTHHRRQENKAAVIKLRIQDLLDPNADLRWDEPQRTQSEGSGTGSHQREATDSSRKKSASMPKDRP